MACGLRGASGCWSRHWCPSPGRRSTWQRDRSRFRRADEAARLGRETGQERWALAADLARATAAGEHGDITTADALADRAEARLMPINAQAMLSLVQFARGRYSVAHQRYPAGFEHLSRVLDPSDVAYHPFVGYWALADLIEAAARDGRRDAR